MIGNMLNIQQNEYHHDVDVTMKTNNHTSDIGTTSALSSSVDNIATTERATNEIDTPINVAAQPLFKCSCTWKNCRAYQKAFRQIQHEIFDGVIKLKILEDDPESIAYQQCLHRTLGIDRQPEWKYTPESVTNQQQQQTQDVDSNLDPTTSKGYCKYIVAKHHFTEQHIRKYESNSKVFSFTKPFSYHGAKKYLYKVDPRETFVASNELTTIVDPTQALYLQCPNVPSDVVKGTYHKIAQVIQQRKKLQNHPKMDASNLGTSTQTIETDYVNVRKEQLQDNNQSPSQHQSNPQRICSQQEQEQQIRSQQQQQQQQIPSQQQLEQQHQIRIQQEQRTVEGGQKHKLSSADKDTSSCQGHISFSTADTSAVHSSEDIWYTSEPKLVQPDVHDASNIDYRAMLVQSQLENRELRIQLDTMKNRFEVLQTMMENFQFKRNDISSSRHSRGSRHTAISSASRRDRRRAKQVASKSIDSLPSFGRAVDYDEHDSNMDHTTVMSRSLDDVSEMQTLATGASFHSKFNPRDADLYENQESESEDEEHSYAECMSLGTSTIVSASRSVKSLPRERELEENGEPSDDEMTFPRESNHRANSVVSAESNTIQSPCATNNSKHNISSSGSLSLLQRRPPTHRYPPITKVIRTVHGQTHQHKRMGQNSVGSFESKQTSSVGSFGQTFDGGTFASSPKSATTSTASVGVYSIIDQQSTANITLSASETYGEHSHYSRQLRVPFATPSPLDQVISIHVTDPHGEHGIYSGQICRETGRPHGFGRLEYDKPGRWYEGEWKLGRWSGRGTISNGSGDLYAGDVANDLKHGFGFMRFADGRTFEGRYDNGDMVDGKMTYEDGSTYEGQWKVGLRHGTGRCIFVDDSIYDGEFKDGEFSGHGKMVWPDGGWYEGDWSNGEMHGVGSEVRPNGTLRHSGQWSRGRPLRPEV